MRTYYRGHDALVTDDAIAWHNSPPKRFPIDELHDVVVVEGNLSPIRRRFGYVAAGSIGVVAASWPMLDTVAAYAAVLVALTATGGIGAACWRMRTRRHELRALHRGQLVVLYASSDVRTFNQVARGLRRAIEDTTPPASGYELAGG